MCLSRNSTEVPAGGIPTRKGGRKRPRADDPGSSRPRKMRKKGRTIDFQDVFQSGRADHKHTIVEFPKDADKWYILRCDVHKMHFGQSPILGAAKHLAAALPAGLSKT